MLLSSFGEKINKFKNVLIKKKYICLTVFNKMHTIHYLHAGTLSEDLKISESAPYIHVNPALQHRLCKLMKTCGYISTDCMLHVVIGTYIHSVSNAENTQIHV